MRKGEEWRKGEEEGREGKRERREGGRREEREEDEARKYVFRSRLRVHVTGCALGVERRGQCFPSKAKGPAEPRLEWVLGYEEYTASNVEGKRHATRRDHRSRALPPPPSSPPLSFIPLLSRLNEVFALSALRGRRAGYRSSIFSIPTDSDFERDEREKEDSPPLFINSSSVDNTHNIHLKNFILEPMEDGAKREILEAMSTMIFSGLSSNFLSV